MKKTRFIALVLVVALALMGAGYAAWTDKLCVETKVKTGYLDVDFTHIYKYEHSKCIKTTEKILPMPGDGEDFPNGSKDFAEIKIENMFPGQKVKYKISLKNEGTLGALLESIKLTNCAGNTIPAQWFKVDYSFMEDGHRYSLNTEEALEGEFELTHRPPQEKVISKGDTEYLYLEFELKDDAPNDITENKEACYKVCLEFLQKCEGSSGGGGWPHGQIMEEEAPPVDL